MAKLTISTPDDLLKQLEKMGDLDKVVPKMLQAAAIPVENAVKKNLQKHNQTNELHDSISTGNAKKGKMVFGLLELQVRVMTKKQEWQTALS